MTEDKNKAEVNIDGDTIYLKRDKLFGGWRTYEPPTKWYHYVIGSKKNIIILIILMIIVALFYLGINEMIAGYKAIADSPCDYCLRCVGQGIQKLNSSFSINLT